MGFKETNLFTSMSLESVIPPENPCPLLCLISDLSRGYNEFTPVLSILKDLQSTDHSCLENYIYLIAEKN